VGTDDAQRAFVEVCDDGIGFDAADVSDRVTSAGGLGLKQMRERIEGRGGVFAIHTSCLHDTAKDKQGTRVYAALPE
jgi:signal transduction histidine kinase